MSVRDLFKDPRISIENAVDLDSVAFAAACRQLARFRFRATNSASTPKLWEHQDAAVRLCIAYLGASRAIPIESISNEAALVKMATGTGKSAIIAVLARCLPQIKRVLILTPREALTDQLFRYVRQGFWTKMGFPVRAPKEIFVDTDGSVTGGPIPLAYITKLLPKTVASIVRAAEQQEERLVLVGTLQALDQIRREAAKPPSGDTAIDAKKDLCRDLIRIIGDFDLVVVDEGHYEPAISWSRAIRDADLPTILFSATPYRNDYKSFRVRGRFVFNQPIKEAIDAKTIRDPRFKPLPGVRTDLGLDQQSRFNVVSAGEDTDDTEPLTSLSDRDKADAVAFVNALKQERLPKLAGIKNPKIIIRADARSKLELLQDEIERTTADRALIIHHGIDKNDDARRRYKSVRAAQADDKNVTVRYWLHQTKLLEGVDDPSFVAVAVYDVFGNARQLVQQIGRALRSSDKNRNQSQRAIIWAAPDLLERIKTSWSHYREFEDYCAENTSHVVTNEAALPDRLLRDMPDLQYVEGQFRPRFMLRRALTVDDIRLPASGAIFEFSGAQFDKSAMKKEITEAILNEDRFQPIEIDGLPDNAVAVAYYGWQTSPLLTRQFFPEWTLGLCIMIKSGNLVLAHDTEGIVFDSAKLDLGRIDQDVLARGLPGSSTTVPVRLSRMSTASLDMSERAIRSQATRTRSFEDTFTDLLDPGMVPTSAYGFINGRGRYLGLMRARIRDAFPEPLHLSNYLRWATSTLIEFTQTGRKKNPVFDRYARVSPPLTTDDAEPQNILLDLGDSFNDFLFDTDDTRVRKALVDADHSDLCADVDDKGKFQVRIDNKMFDCEIKFTKSGRYNVTSRDLDGHFFAKSDGGRQSAMTFTQILNRNQAFRLIPKKQGVVYANGTFYLPQGFEPRPDGTISQLQDVIAVPILSVIITEKGEDLYFPKKSAWKKQSLFGLMKSMADHSVAATPAEWGELGNAVACFDLIVCDDDGEEVGDFLAIDSKNRLACIIHAKASKDGHSMSVTAIEAVGRQALASLAFCSTTSLPPKIKDKRWESDVNANGKTLTGLNRVFKNSRGLDAAAILKEVTEALTNRSWNREIWILAARLLDRAAFEKSIRAGVKNRNWQLLMYIDSLGTACARGNARLRIYCH